MKSTMFIWIFSALTISCAEKIESLDYTHLNENLKDQELMMKGLFDSEPLEVEIDTTRPLLEFGVSPVSYYTSTQIDQFNAYLVSDIGSKVGLRNKTVEAADFLMRFARVIPYAYEYGRPDYKYVARYARTGLFFENFDEGGYTYQSWGRPVSVIPPYYDYVSNLDSTYINGLHCSGFIGWCLHNAGYSKPTLVNLDTVTANGYGNFPETYQLDFAGNVDSIEVGDLLHFPGHVAIVTRIDGAWITISECALWSNNHTDPRNGARKRKFNRYHANIANYRFKKLIKMRDAYDE